MADKKKLPLAKPLITSWQWHASLFSILSDDENAKKWIFSNYIQLRCYDIEERWTGDTILLTDMMPGSSSLKQCPYLMFSLMTKAQIEEAYEANTGVVIREAFEGINPMHTPAVLVAHHGPFTWGKSAKEAVQNSVILEEVAKMATMTLTLNPSIEMNGDLVEKHYNRKHGANAYYGQKECK